jgi:hypothetical protein
MQGYSDPDSRNFQDTEQSNSSNLFRLHNSMICYGSKKHTCMSTYRCEAEYMGLAFATRK